MNRIVERKGISKIKLSLIVLISFVIFFLVFFLFFYDRSSKLKVDYNQLSIGIAKKEKFQEFIPIDGIVQPIRTFYVDAVQGGRVEKKYVDDGAMVKMGDTLMKLSNPTLELEYMNRETQMYDIINNLQNTKLKLEQNRYTQETELLDLNAKIDKCYKDYLRKSKFHHDKVISDQDFEDATREYDLLISTRKIVLKAQKHDSVFTLNQIYQIKQSIERLQKNLILLKENLGSLYIKAAISGMYSLFDCEIGETKIAGDKIGQIDVLDGYKLRAKIDERYIARVYKGQLAEYENDGKIYLLSVNKIYTEVKNSNFEIDLLFLNDCPQTIKRGQTLQLRLQFSGVSDAITIPRGGFFQETGGNWIYIVNSENKFAIKRNIKIGRQNIKSYEVLEGLKEGDKIIISGYENYGAKEKLIFINN